jgi:hypothetical protein
MRFIPPKHDPFTHNQEDFAGNRHMMSREETEKARLKFINQQKKRSDSEINTQLINGLSYR